MLGVWVPSPSCSFAATLLFFAPCRSAILARVRKTDFAFDPPFWSKISEDAKDFVQQCLRSSPSERLSVTEALHHPWIKTLAGSSPSGCMLSSFALNLRRFYRTSLIEITAANLLAAKVNFGGLQEFYARCREADVNGSSFLTASDLRQVLSNCGHVDITDQISTLSSRHLRHPGESYLDYTAIVASVKARRERMLEEDLWQQFCAFTEVSAVGNVSASRSDHTTTMGFSIGGDGSASGKPAESGRMPLPRLSKFLEVANVRASLSYDGLEDIATIVRALSDASGSAIASSEVDFIEVVSEVIRQLPPVGSA